MAPAPVTPATFRAAVAGTDASCRPSTRRAVISHALLSRAPSTSAGTRRPTSFAFAPGDPAQEVATMRKIRAPALLAACLVSMAATRAIAQPRPPEVAQIVALDECDPQSFNAALGEEGTGFCHNVTLY